MKILCYLEPWVELGRPHLRYHNLRYQMMPQIKALSKFDPSTEILICMGEGTHDACVQNNYDADRYPTTIVPETELRQIFPNYLDASLKLKSQTYSAAQKVQLQNLYLTKLEGFEPDIVISFLSPVPFMEELFPNALILYTEFGIFSRAPLPRTFYFDAFGMFGENFMSRYTKELNALELTPKKSEYVSKLRSDYINNVFNPYDPFKEYDFKDNGRFSHTVLLPLQFSNYFGFDSHTEFASQFDFLTYVMDTIDPTIGVIVTEHSTWERAITEHNVEYLKRRYPNIIIDPVFEQYNNASQFLLQHVDGVISVSSSVGLQALLWDKPVFALGSAHLHAISDCTETSDIGSFLREKKHQNKDAILYELLMRYYPEDKYLNDGKWFQNYLSTLLDAKRANKLGFDSYPQIDKPQKVFKHLRSCARISPNFILRRDLQTAPVGRTSTEKQIASLVAKQNELSKAILSHDIISFDVFDTLVVRPFMAPHHLFLSIQNQVRNLCMDSSMDFHELRRRAEHRARQNTSDEEITLDDIYVEFRKETGLSAELAKAIQHLEVEAEIEHIQPRSYVHEAYQEAIKLGRKVILVSDMYLDRETIERMLKKCGIANYARLYLSSEEKKTKARGSLFQVVISDYPDAKQNAVHIGDNKQADYLNAKRAGIDALMVEKPINLFFENRDNQALWSAEKEMKIFPSRDYLLNMSYFLGVVANKAYSNPYKKSDFMFDGKPYQLGYYGLGILFFAFTRHILRDAKKKGYTKLLFMSRDAYLLHKCFEQITNGDSGAPEAHYVYSSRRSYSVAALQNLSEIYSLLNVSFAECTVEELLLSRFGLDEKALQKLKGSEITKCGFETLGDTVRATNAEHKQQIRQLLKLLEKDILANARQERENFQTYLAQEKIVVDESTAIVDIGYAATSQRYLSKLTNTKVGGYYLITRLEAADYEQEGYYINAFLDNYVDHRNPEAHPFFRYTMMFENVFSSQEGSLNRFVKDTTDPSGKRVVPELLPTEGGLNRISTLTTIQRGAMDFVSDLQAQSGSNFQQLYFSPFYAARVFFRFLENPTYQDALIFNNLSVDDTFSVRKTRPILADFLPYFNPKQSFRSKDEATLREQSEWSRGARAIILRLRKQRGLPSREVTQSTLDANPPMLSFEFIAPERMKDRLRRFRLDPYGFLSTTRIRPLRGLKKVFRD